MYNEDDKFNSELAAAEEIGAISFEMSAKVLAEINRLRAELAQARAEIERKDAALKSVRKWIGNQKAYDELSIGELLCLAGILDHALSQFPERKAE
jgi:hypothetical protein